MANAKKCDRCGRLYEIYTVRNTGLRFNVIKRLGKDDTDRIFYEENDKDLCPDCMRAFEVFMHNDVTKEISEDEEM